MTAERYSSPPPSRPEALAGILRIRASDTELAQYVVDYPKLRKAKKQSLDVKLNSNIGNKRVGGERNGIAYYAPTLNNNKWHRRRDFEPRVFGFGDPTSYPLDTPISW